MPPEFFDVIDEEDKVVGRRLGSECVRSGLLHRAIVVFVFDGAGRLYVQRRADSMSWYPGHWTVSVMGHVSSGETYLQAARRETREELGLDVQLERVAEFLTPKWRYHEMTEWERIVVFEGRTDDPSVRLSEETAEGRFVPFDDFLAMAEGEPERLTPDTLLALEKYLTTKRGDPAFRFPSSGKTGWSAGFDILR